MHYHMSEWFTPFSDGVVRIYSETTEDGWQVRKVHEFTSGQTIKVGRWRKVSIKYKMGLSDQRSRPIDELNSDEYLKDKMKASHITEDEFESVWRKARYSW